MRKNITLIEPTIDYKEQLLSYKSEFLYEGIPIDGGGGLGDFPTIESYLENLEIFKNKNTVPEGKVSSTTFMAITYNNELVGILNIRHELNDSLIISGGHIGYGVRKKERQKGYATEMLRLALLKCKDFGIEKALVTCNVENIGSAKTIENNGGVLEDERINGKHRFKRFWIDIN